MRTIPTCSPLGPTRRTSGTRILSLTRNSLLMSPPGVLSVYRPRRPPRTAGASSRDADTIRPRPDDLTVDAGGRWTPLWVRTAGSANRSRTRIPVVTPAPHLRPGRSSPDVADLGLYEHLPVRRLRKICPGHDRAYGARDVDDDRGGALRDRRLSRLRQRH